MANSSKKTSPTEINIEIAMGRGGYLEGRAWLNDNPDNPTELKVLESTAGDSSLKLRVSLNEEAPAPVEPVPADIAAQAEVQDEQAQAQSQEESSK